MDLGNRFAKRVQAVEECEASGSCPAAQEIEDGTIETERPRAGCSRTDSLRRVESQIILEFISIPLVPAPVKAQGL